MITNKTTNKIISKQEIVCKDIFSQGLGLMFKLKEQNLIMIFNKERDIILHNFFVCYPLDLLVLDKDKKVVEIKENFKPFTFWSSQKKGKYLLELGQDCSKGKVKVGDKLKF